MNPEITDAVIATLMRRCAKVVIVAPSVATVPKATVTVTNVGSAAVEIFSELDHRLSVVKRWGILHTIQTQSVAEHVQNVSRIALRIAISWFNLQDHTDLYLIVRWGLEHDDMEALTGDLPTMVKPYFDEAAAAKDHVDLTGGEMVVPQAIRNIVKLADLMEGFYFIAIEIAMGNEYARNHYSQYFSEISNYAIKTFDPTLKIDMRVADWMNEMHVKGLRSTRYSRRGR